MGKKTNNSLVQFKYKGILPPPKVLEQYNKEIPDGADRLMKLVENQSDHRRKMESKYVSSNILIEWMGLLFGFLCLLVILAGSIYLIINGYGIEGTILGSIDVVSLVGLFVYGSKKKRS